MGERTINIGHIVVTDPDGSRRCTCGQFHLPADLLGDDDGTAAVAAHLATHAGHHGGTMAEGTPSDHPR